MFLIDMQVQSLIILFQSKKKKRVKSKFKCLIIHN